MDENRLKLKVLFFFTLWVKPDVQICALEKKKKKKTLRNAIAKHTIRDTYEYANLSILRIYGTELDNFSIYVQTCA